jgi:cytochrome-b5 reductase
MSSATPTQNEYLTKKYIDGVYIPSGLLVFGCLIVKREWVPYAVVLALLLGGYKVYSNSKDS